MTSKPHARKSQSTTASSRLPKGFRESRANVDGVMISYKIGGRDRS